MARVGGRWLGRPAVVAALLLVAVGFAPGCGRIRARRSLKAGNAAYKENRWAAALESFGQVPAESPEQLQARLGVAYVHMSQFRPGSTRQDNLDHVTSALAAFDAYLKLRPPDSKDANLPGPDEVQTWVIEMLVGSERYGDAIARMEAELKLKPNDPAMLRGIAQANEKWGKLVEAVEFYRQWAATFPKDPAPHVAIAAFCWNISYRRAKGLEPLERNRWIDTGLASADAALRIETEHFEGLTYQQLLLRERAKMRIDPDVIAATLEKANAIHAKVSEMRKKKKEEEEAAKKAKVGLPGTSGTAGGPEATPTPRPTATP